MKSSVVQCCLSTKSGIVGCCSSKCGSTGTIIQAQNQDDRANETAMTPLMNTNRRAQNQDESCVVFDGDNATVMTPLMNTNQPETSYQAQNQADSNGHST